MDGVGVVSGVEANGSSSEYFCGRQSPYDKPKSSFSATVLASYDEGSVRPTFSYGCSEATSYTTGSSSASAPSVVVDTHDGFATTDLQCIPKLESIQEGKKIGDSNTRTCTSKQERNATEPCELSMKGCDEPANSHMAWSTFSPINASLFETSRSEPLQSVSHRRVSSRSDTHQSTANLIPPSILKRESIANPQTTGLTATLLQASSSESQKCDSKRSNSTLSHPAHGEAEAFQSLHRVNSAVRFQLPSDASSPQVTGKSPGKEKSGILGFLMSLWGRTEEHSQDTAKLNSDSSEEAPKDRSTEVPQPTAVEVNRLGVANIDAQLTDDAVSAGRSKLLESFRSEGDAEESPNTICKDVASPSIHGSQRRFEQSASPTGSFYFAGNNQVYIPDAPEDLVDIPLNNVSFAGGGSFCSSPVVFSNRLKAVDVSHNLQVLNDQYVLYTDKLIGSGSFGEVFLCYSISEEIYYAAKALDRRRLKKLGIGTGNNGMEKLLNEISIMQKLRHDNIIALKEVINDSGSNSVYLILELAGYGPLLRLEKGLVEEDCEGNTRIDEATVQELVHSMIQALVYAHKLGVAHRDIKPDNLLLTNDSQLKVSDFGVSCLVDKKTPLDREGSIAFLPPEMLLPITKDKFIAPSPHVSGFYDGGDSGDESVVSLDRLLDNRSGSQYQADEVENIIVGMTPLAMDVASDSFAYSFTRRASGNPDPAQFADFVMVGAESTTNPPDTAKNMSTGVSKSARNVSSRSAEACSLHRSSSRMRLRDGNRDSLTSPRIGSCMRQSKVGWRYVNRNEIDLFKADVWAVGVTAFVMLHGRLPWLAHLDPIEKSESDTTALNKENNITEYLDPQSRFRLHLYQKWKARQERPNSNSFANCADHSYLSPYRLGNASFNRPFSDAEQKLEYSCEATSLSSPVNIQSSGSFEQGSDKEDKQNVEYAFWKYWSELVQDSQLGQRTPLAPTDKQLRAILCHPDPVTLVHTPSSLRRNLPKPPSWEVLASSDDDSGNRKAQEVFGPSDFHPKEAFVQVSNRQHTRRRARSVRIVDHIDDYLSKLQKRFGDSFGKCESCSPLASSFIRECLQLDPVVRPTMSDLLQHEWLAQPKAAYEKRTAATQTLSTSQKMFADIPVVEEGEAGSAADPSASLVKAEVKINSTAEEPSQDTNANAPKRTRARPIASDEIANLPKQLPKLFNSVANTAGFIKASQYQLAFKSLLPTQRRATDDSALLDLRQQQLKESTTSASAKQACMEGSDFAGSSSSPREASPIRMLLGAQKGDLPPRSLSLPVRLDELGTALELLESMGEQSPSPTGRATRKRTMTMAPVFMQALDSGVKDSSPPKQAAE